MWLLRALDILKCSALGVPFVICSDVVWSAAQKLNDRFDKYRILRQLYVCMTLFIQSDQCFFVENYGFCHIVDWIVFGYFASILPSAVPLTPEASWSMRTQQASTNTLLPLLLIFQACHNYFPGLHVSILIQFRTHNNRPHEHLLNILHSLYNIHTALSISFI